YLTVGERREPAKDQAKDVRREQSATAHYLSLGSDRRPEVRGQRSEVRLSHARNSKRETRDSKLARAMVPMPSGETVTVNGAGSGFTLPIGKSITITFQVTLNNLPNVTANPYPTGDPQVSTQGTVSGTNFS